MAFKYVQNDNSTLTIYDPLYGQFIVKYPFSKIILTKEMQRLNNISQNGFSQYEFKGLENNDRLSHSVGSFHVMGLILDHIESLLSEYNIQISDDDKDIALCSMLLHDIGHGPFSHSLEHVTNYSHEKRTADILLGETEVGYLLLDLYGKKKVKQIASFIAEINNSEDLGKDSFTKLLKSLVSHQLDADRIDYLARDAYYIGIPSSINLDRILSNLNIIVDSNKEYELLILKNGLSCIENVLIQRYQMYRDVYFSPMSLLYNERFKQILDRFKNNLELSSLPVSDSFKILATDHSVSNLDDFVNMSDLDFKNSFATLEQNDIDKIIKYLCNFNNADDYILIENNVSVQKIKSCLQEIFPGFDLSNLLSIITVSIKSKMYKKEQNLKIQLGNRICYLSECTNLISPQNVFENTYTFFNPELLMLELNLSKEEFKKYTDDISKMIDYLNKKPEEFELKYSIDGKNDSLLEELLNILIQNGFKIISTSTKQNHDEYYDTRDLSLYRQGGSLRCRKVSESNNMKYKFTYKKPLIAGEVYSSRTEIEEKLPDNSFSSFILKVKETNIPIDDSLIVSFPFLTSITNRNDVVLEKNGIQVCLSLDNSFYINSILDTQASDTMIEIEAIGKLNNRIILNEIHELVTKNIQDLNIIKQSKYERGINYTSLVYSYAHDLINQEPSSIIIKKLGNKNI